MTQGTRVLLGTTPNNHLTTVCLSFPSASFCTRRLQVKGTAVSQTLLGSLPLAILVWGGVTQNIRGKDPRPHVGTEWDTGERRVPGLEDLTAAGQGGQRWGGGLEVCCAKQCGSAVVPFSHSR